AALTVLLRPPGPGLNPSPGGPMKKSLQVCAAVLVAAGIAFAAHALSSDTFAEASGGGTVVVGGIVASFGFNAERPPDFTGGGAAVGRINYDKHAKVAAGNHVSVPVVSMAAILTSTPTPNGSGGHAQIG